MTRCILGVDPGATGGLAFYFPDAHGRIAVEDMPLVNGKVCPHGLKALLLTYGPTEAIVELVGPMPKQGVTSVWNFSGAYHTALATIAVLEVPYALVAPGKWKKRMGLPSEKEAARAMAIRTFPHVAARFSRVKDHNRAEAALLAYYRAHVMDERAVA
jgi:hypothetical protein